jgi:hypothetical protein
VSVLERKDRGYRKEQTILKEAKVYSTLRRMFIGFVVVPSAKSIPIFYGASALLFSLLLETQLRDSRVELV